MKIAIPITNGVLSSHFGHCEEFALLDANGDSKSIEGSTMVKAPPHEPGLLPAWLAEKGVNLIIAGGMGQRARDLFDANSIGVVVGAPSDKAEDLVTAYLGGNLESGENACDH
jgi:predicted Fe-Mo cluster-binding NifX family protein